MVLLVPLAPCCFSPLSLLQKQGPVWCRAGVLEDTCHKHMCRANPASRATVSVTSHSTWPFITMCLIALCSADMIKMQPCSSRYPVQHLAHSRYPDKHQFPFFFLLSSCSQGLCHLQLGGSLLTAVSEHQHEALIQGLYPAATTTCKDALAMRDVPGGVLGAPTEHSFSTSLLSVLQQLWQSICIMNLYGHRSCSLGEDFKSFKNHRKKVQEGYKGLCRGSECSHGEHSLELLS